MRSRLLVLLFLCITPRVFGQDTIRVMYYNLLNFPGDFPGRIADLRKIVSYVQPDILVVNELLSAEGASLILTDALNSGGVTHYNAATYVNGPDTDNMLYYNADVLGLKSQLQLPTGLRDISEYELFYKSPGLSSSSDTIFFHIYSLHLKAGTGYFNQRKEEAIVFKYHLNNLTNSENILAGGDFNFYSGNESGCLAMRETGDIELYDPLNSIGDWNNNASYAYLHTQSTRVDALADGAGGGLDDRFDLIFAGGDIFDNSNGVTYIEGSYHALGQDGFRFNQSINSPFNPSIPDSIADALYFMSDHLPVIMDLKLDYTAGLDKNQVPTIQVKYLNTYNQLLISGILPNYNLRLYDLSGKLILNQTNSETSQINLPANLSEGIYIWEITTPELQLTGKFLR